MKNKEKENAANCIKAILESYIEFLEYIHKTDDMLQIRLIGNTKHNCWKPMLDKVNSDLNKLKEIG